MTKTRYLHILLIVSILLVACKTQKKLNRERSAELEVIYDSITAGYIDYETLLIKSTTNYESKNKKINLKGTIKIHKDSIIIISLSPGLGIEAARIKFTKDSLFILDRFSSQVTRGDYKFINDTYKVNIGYGDVQAILTNELFIYPLENGTAISEEFVNSFNVRSNKETLDLYRKTDQLIENLISINTKHYTINKYIINDSKNRRNLNIQFEDVYSDEFGNLPKKIFVVSSADDKFNKIKLNYTKVTKNRKLNFSFRIPRNYKSIVY